MKAVRCSSFVAHITENTVTVWLTPFIARYVFAGDRITEAEREYLDEYWRMLDGPPEEMHAPEFEIITRNVTEMIDFFSEPFRSDTPMLSSFMRDLLPDERVFGDRFRMIVVYDVDRLKSDMMLYLSS